VGPKGFAYNVRHRFFLDRRATAEFLIKFTIETERHLPDIRPYVFALCHYSEPFEVEPHWKKYREGGKNMLGSAHERG